MADNRTSELIEAASYKISELTEATQAELTNDGLLVASVVDGNSSTGFSTRKTLLSRLASYALNTFTMALGGTTRTVKSAIDSIQTLLGSTSISGIGGGTVTGAISALNSDLAKSSDSITVTMSGISDTSNSVVMKSGNVVDLRINVGNGTVMSAFTTSETICTLPSKYRPQSQKFIYGYIRTVGGWAVATYIPLLVQINTEGAVRVFGKQADIRTGQYVTIEGCYII